MNKELSIMPINTFLKKSPKSPFTLGIKIMKNPIKMKALIRSLRLILSLDHLIMKKMKESFLDEISFS
jgi:hypothetical protein